MKGGHGGMAVVILLALLLLAGAVWAATANDPSANWSVINSGGAAVSTGNVALNGSLGQPISGPPAGQDGVAVHSGYWPGTAGTSHTLYLPAVMQ
ncbi:MAG: hypothetical protein ACK2UK_18835 [Candidatus Promineifilaceae bacterium]